jgi:hypothetical protein
MHLDEMFSESPSFSPETNRENFSETKIDKITADVQRSRQYISWLPVQVHDTNNECQRVEVLKAERGW